MSIDISALVEMSLDVVVLCEEKTCLSTSQHWLRRGSMSNDISALVEMSLDVGFCFLEKN